MTPSHEYRYRIAWQERRQIAGPDELHVEVWQTWQYDRAAIATGGGGERIIDNTTTEQTATVRLKMRWNPAYQARWQDLTGMRICDNTGRVFHPRGVHNVDGLNREILVEASCDNDFDPECAQALST